MTIFSRKSRWRAFSASTSLSTSVTMSWLSTYFSNILMTPDFNFAKSCNKWRACCEWKVLSPLFGGEFNYSLKQKLVGIFLQPSNKGACYSTWGLDFWLESNFFTWMCLARSWKSCWKCFMLADKSAIVRRYTNASLSMELIWRFDSAIERSFFTFNVWYLHLTMHN